MDVRDMDDLIGADVVEKVKMENLVEEYLNSKDEKDKMKVLNARGVSQAVAEYVTKQEKDAINVLCDHQITKTKKYLHQQTFTPDPSEIKLQLKSFQVEREEASTSTFDDFQGIKSVAKTDSLCDVGLPQDRISCENDLSYNKSQRLPQSCHGRKRVSAKKGVGPTEKEKKNTQPLMSSFTNKFLNTGMGKSQSIFLESESFMNQFDQTSHVAKRNRDKGVTYISSDEDDNKFAQLIKRRR
uniref:Uncharacterized protein n=1 Tax=Ciona savignyi TaxID=51511 RepID=H2YQ16_CIOSA